MLFSDFALKPSVIAALDKQGYKEPTKIQEEVIKFALEGKNIVGQSQTGTGKTAAFVIPLLELIDTNVRKPQAIIMAPTRELANQIREEFVKLSEGMFMRSTAVYGGSPIRAQRDALEKGPQIVVATPGRLIDLIERRYIDLRSVKYFILDEVDRMLDMGFVDDIDHVWSKLTDIKQSMTFSATIPQEIKNLLAKYVGDGYESIKATEGLTVSKIDHSFIEVPHFEKFEMLKKYVDQHKGQKVVVFARMKHETEELADKLIEAGYSADCLHGDMRQRERAQALRSFQEGRCQIFVTTDVAARGLNMKDIELVVNYHVPEDPEAYIHRIGRTGRAGAEGRAIMFVDKAERNYLRNIERRNKIQIKQVNFSGDVIERKLEQGSHAGGGHSRHGSRRSFGGGQGGGYRGGDRGGRSSGGGYREGNRGEVRNNDRGGYAPSRPSNSGWYGARTTQNDFSDWGFGGSRSQERSNSAPRDDAKPRHFEDRKPREGGYFAGREDKPKRDFPPRREGGFSPRRDDRGPRPSRDRDDRGGYRGDRDRPTRPSAE